MWRQVLLALTALPLGCTETDTQLSRYFQVRGFMTARHPAAVEAEAEPTAFDRLRAAVSSYEEREEQEHDTYDAFAAYEMWTGLA